jgi:hypothetical protein
MGKSAFAAYLVQYFKSLERFLGGFFCQYGQESNNSRNILKSLACQIATYLPESRPFILEGIESVSLVTVPVY